MTASKGRWLGKENAQSMVEFALTAWLLFSLLFSFLDFGRAFYVQNSLTYAASRAARYGVVHPQDISGIEEVARNSLFGISTDGLSVSTTISSDEVDVVVRYNFRFIFSIFVGRGSVTLTGHAAMQRL
jgi:Flp pilus assembly protein TadG